MSELANLSSYLPVHSQREFGDRPRHLGEGGDDENGGGRPLSQMLPLSRHLITVVVTEPYGTNASGSGTSGAAGDGSLTATGGGLGSTGNASPVKGVSKAASGALNQPSASTAESKQSSDFSRVGDTPIDVLLHCYCGAVILNCC